MIVATKCPNWTLAGSSSTSSILRRVCGRCDIRGRNDHSRCYGSSRRNFSSTTSTRDDGGTQQQHQQRQLQLLAPSMYSLGVFGMHIIQHPSAIQSLAQLPEVVSSIQNFQQQHLLGTTALSTKRSSSSLAAVLDALERSCQIFQSMMPGSIEHIASLALLAEYQSQSNLFPSCYETLHDLQGRLDNTNDSTILLALAKAHWLNGEHEVANEKCRTVLQHQESAATTKTSTLIEAAARTGLAVSQMGLLSTTTLDDAFCVRDPFRAVVKLLENHRTSSTALAAAYCNMGIAEVVYAETVSQINNVNVPFDAAMRNWKYGLTELKKQPYHDRKTIGVLSSTAMLRSELQARLYANMAYGMLQMTHERDYISRATEYATESLAIYDGMMTKQEKEDDDAYRRAGLGRTLSLLATCYQLTGNAITAQGLFQSAIDSYHHPQGGGGGGGGGGDCSTAALQMLEEQDALRRYAKLCSDWDKREGDATKLQQQAHDIDTTLPYGWQNKSPIHGSLWFWTPDVVC